MGLDMYLNRKVYVGANWEHNKINGEINLRKGEKQIPVNFDKVTYITEEVMYWRKANQIHKFFVDNVQDGNDDCKDYYVSTDDLCELLDICKQIKEKCPLVSGKVKVGERFENGEWVAIIEDGKVMQNAEFAAKLLPCESGFFFGSTNYDQYYMQDIEKTIEVLTEILKQEEEYNKNGFYSDFEYSSSW